jgi:hypothetical protein
MGSTLDFTWKDHAGSQDNGAARKTIIPVVVVRSIGPKSDPYSVTFIPRPLVNETHQFLPSYPSIPHPIFFFLLLLLYF